MKFVFFFIRKFDYAMTSFLYIQTDLLKPGVHLIVMIAETSVSNHSDQMDTSLLTIPTIVTIAVAGIGSGFIPAIVTIMKDRNVHMDTRQRS